jgi:serine/threonine-protein kinase
MSDIPSAATPPDLGERYVIEGVVGEGSVGKVYRATDRQLGRTVAIKILSSREPVDVALFQREARALASIDHEHVGRIFDVGQIDGHVFLAMQYVQGPTLRALARELDLETKIELLEQVARAIQAAHAGGVLHRDLKPGNIIVERRPNGSLHAHVLDFGIARAARATDSAAAPDLLGTPAYAAPEQLVANGSVDQRTDVYGLGAITYAVLAEQAPFFGASRGEVRDRVLGEDPIRLGLVVPGTPDDLETIVSVAMAKDPNWRYASAAAFADDLGRWRRGEPIRSRTAGPIYRAGTWLRRRWPAAVLLAVVLVLVGAAVGAGLRVRHQNRLRQALIDQHQNVIDQIDDLLRRARMMPLHDTTPAESIARDRLATVEASLLATGPLARGPAYYALGFGHLMLREFDEAEDWLQAAVGSGLADPEVESALGIAQAMRLLTSADRGPVSDPERVSAAVEHLAASGPGTVDRDSFHRALALMLEGRFDEALESARESSRRVPWLYEALQLEGDILVARSRVREANGDPEGALADLASAGDAYERGLEVARSDAWLYRADAERVHRIIEIRLRTGDLDPDDPELGELRERVDRRFSESRSAAPR